MAAVAAPAATLLQNGGLIEDAVDYQVGERRPGKLMALRRSLRAIGSDTLIYMNGGRSLLAVLRDLIFFRLCGFRRIIGAPLSRDLLFVRQDPESGQVEREVERLVRALAELGPIDLTDRAGWDLRLTSEEKAAGERFLAPLGGRPFVAINTGGKVQINDWGLPNWEALLGRLSRRLPGHALVVVGAKEDEARAEHLSAFWEGPVLSGCGRLAPRESAAVLGRARLFVGHDSGPLHLAAAVGAPCVSMFGDNNPPRKWHPIGAQHRIIHDMAGVSAISPDRVFQAVEEALAVPEKV